MIKLDQLVLASHNAGKLKELQAMLGAHVKVRSIGEFSDVEPEETGLSFVENAILKARNAARISGLPALADDSGLAVDHLGGAPGIYSARWAGATKDFSLAMARVERELKDKGAVDFSAKFVCVLALASPNGDTETFRGQVEGHLVFPPRGTKGFGYDPIFVSRGMTETFAEIAPAAKHAMSHRAKAFEKLVNSPIFR